MNVAAHKIELYVVDHEGMDVNEVISILHNNQYYNFKIMTTQSVDIPEWTDDHLLNQRNCSIEQVREFFNKSYIGNGL
jgi:hypothetical protein